MDAEKLLSDLKEAQAYKNYGHGSNPNYNERKIIPLILRALIYLFERSSRGKRIEKSELIKKVIWYHKNNYSCRQTEKALWNDYAISISYTSVARILREQKELKA